MRRFLSVAMLFSLAACYEYVPIGSAVPEPGQEVRAHLSPVQDFDVGTLTIRDVTHVDGIVYASTADSVALWSTWLYSILGTRFDSRQAVYYLPKDQVAMLEERRLHPARSVIGVGLGVGILAVVANFLADAGGSPGSGGKGGPIQVRSAGPLR